MHLWPAVPTAANTADLTTMSTSASSDTIRQLLPPNSNRCLPNLSWTVSATCLGDFELLFSIEIIIIWYTSIKMLLFFVLTFYLPTSVLPVKETSFSLLSAAMARPTSVPPWQRAEMAPGRLFLSSTSATTLVMATEVRGVVGAPFQIMVLPQDIAMAEFQPYTATGKLKAVMIPTTPSGFQFSRRAWPGLSLGITFPLNILLSPTA